jgi:hypothetical protein
MSTGHSVTFLSISQYYVTVKSEYGTITGAGWYDSGSTASFSLSPSSMSAGFLTYHVFSGWSGDSTSKNSTASVIVDSPKVITATWAVDSTQLYLAVIGVVILVIVLGAVVWMRSRHPKPKEIPQGPPSPDGSVPTTTALELPMALFLR